MHSREMGAVLFFLPLFTHVLLSGGFVQKLEKCWAPPSNDMLVLSTNVVALYINISVVYSSLVKLVNNSSDSLITIS